MRTVPLCCSNSGPRLARRRRTCTPTVGTVVGYHRYETSADLLLLNKIWTLQSTRTNSCLLTPRWSPRLLQKKDLDRKWWTTREELRLEIVTRVEKIYHRRRRRQRALMQTHPDRVGTLQSLRHRLRILSSCGRHCSLSR